MKKLTYEERVRQRMPKPKRPSRKFVLIEVETTLSNAVLSAEVCGAVTRVSDTGGFAVVHVLQVHVNAAKKESKR